MSQNEVGMSAGEGQEKPPRALSLTLITAALLSFVYYQWSTIVQFRSGLVRGDAIQVFHSLMARMAAGEEMILLQFDNHQFTNHVMLVLFPWAQIYRLVDDPFVYLTPLNLALALAILPLGWLAWERTRSIPVSLAIVCLYAIGHLTTSLRLSVHIESMLIPIWLFLFWAMSTKRWLILWIVVALALSIKEDQPVWLAFFALWALLFHREAWRHWVALLIVSAIAFIGFRLLMGAAPQETDYGAGDFWIPRVRAEAESMSDLIWLFFANPLSFLVPIIFSPTWIPLLLSGGVICLLGWRPMLLLLLPAGLFLPAEFIPFSDLLYYYSYPFLPPLLFAAVEGARVLQSWLAQRGGEHWLVAGILIVALANPFVPSRVDGMGFLPPTVPGAERARHQLARELINRHIPNDPTVLVAAHYDFGGFLPSGRQLRFLRQDHIEQADFVIIDVGRLSLDVPRERYIELVDWLANSDEWSPLGQYDTIILLGRCAP